jgi:predicted nuclease of restriction endonuclease-like RecB superfamily
MLLPLDCVAYEVVGGRVLPTWLRAEDEPFVAAVLEAVWPLAGLSAGEAEIAADTALWQLTRRARLPRRVGEALWNIERRRWEVRVESPVEPEVLRDVLFELSARLGREEAIAEAARRLAIPSEVVVGSLFADRPSRRLLRPPPVRARPSDLMARYNLAIAQSLLARSMELSASIDGDRSAVVSAAKRDGLLVRFEASGDGDATAIEIAGPLALFHDTAKYGRSIARFVPALLAASRWSLCARVTLGSRSAELQLESEGAVAFPAVLPAAPDGRLARRVARKLRTVGVRVDPAPGVLRAGSTLVVPDFAIEWSCRRVFVDVVPFATPEYLARKREAVAKIGHAMLVCVDERHAPLEAPWVVPYRREIDPWALYAAAQRLVGDAGRSFDLGSEAMAE